MEIIRQGELPKGDTYEAQCRMCDTVFRFNSNEARPFTVNADFVYYVIDCPVCKSPVLPREWRWLTEE